MEYTSSNFTPEKAYSLTAVEARDRIRNGDMTVLQYVQSLLRYIESHHHVGAWAYLDKNMILQKAQELDQVPAEQRGCLHGVPIGVKDVIYTKGGSNYVLE